VHDPAGVRGRELTGSRLDSLRHCADGPNRAELTAAAELAVRPEEGKAHEGRDHEHDHDERQGVDEI
jgi:hypothetical protein